MFYILQSLFESCVNVFFIFIRPQDNSKRSVWTNWISIWTLKQNCIRRCAHHLSRLQVIHEQSSYYTTEVGKFIIIRQKAGVEVVRRYRWWHLTLWKFSSQIIDRGPYSCRIFNISKVSTVWYDDLKLTICYCNYSPFNSGFYS